MRGRADPARHLPDDQPHGVHVPLLERLEVRLVDGVVEHLGGEVPLGAHLAVEGQVQGVGAAVVPHLGMVVSGVRCHRGVYF